MPWLTLSAFFVIGFSVVLAVAWAVHDIRNSGGDKSKH